MLDHLLIATLLLTGATADLPDGCEPLNDKVFSNVDPTQFFEANYELEDLVPLRWIGGWRATASVPTQHFAINQVKPGAAPLRLMPYSAVLSASGITYDAYTMDRWGTPTRSDEMQQQTPSAIGEPWNKVTSLGTNMKQMVSGPDGNPKAEFTGNSGLQVGIAGSSDPVWAEFGEMFANFLYTGTGGGTMEVPLVRGSALLTHKFTNANPVVSPLCLSAVNGISATSSCPAERDASDGGEGFLGGQCGSGTLRLDLHTTKPIQMSNVQWAANTLADWSNNHGMNTCGSECRDVNGDGRYIQVTVPGQFSGQMAFAMNVIGKFVIPPAWIDAPMTTSCFRSADEERAEPIHPRHIPRDDNPNAAAACSVDFCHTPSCLIEGATNNFQLIIELATPVSGANQIQFAVEKTSSWGPQVPMLTCSDLGSGCVASTDLRTFTFTKAFDEQLVSYAVNVMGRFVMPPGDWQNNPYRHDCNDGPPGEGTTAVPPGGEIDRGVRFVLELDEPLGNLPSQTRKFLLHFSQEVIATVGGDGQLTFSPVAGGTFNGLMQIGYAGSNQRGDLSAANFYDPYLGVYSYRPMTSFCAQGGLGYIDFGWNKHDVNGPTGAGQLLMITMPHQETLLAGQCSLLATPFTFKGCVQNSWLLQETLPVSSMEPNAAAVEAIKNNPAQLQDILAAIERDTQGNNLNAVCVSSNSYGVGKDISMVARLASISRAFGTAHYSELDERIRTCLEKWLRIDDSLDGANKFRYDAAYKGLLLRSVPDGQPIDPGANFGFPLYSDHHFHLGYFLYALGYYALYYPAWASTYRERFLLIARDVGSPSRNDGYFPVVRHKDFYVGISWATGLVGGLRQAESSTEAIACYHGLAALGLALGDTTMESVGQLMLATEIRSVREYYHLRSYNRYFFPQQIQAYGTIGQFAEDAIFYYTLNWPCDPFEFPMRHACLVGIQVIPVMSISGLFMDQEWAGSVMNICTWAINPTTAPGAELVDPEILRPVSKGWGAFCHAVTSQYDAQAQQRAADYVRGLGPGQLVGGTGEASTLLFIYGST